MTGPDRPADEPRNWPRAGTKSPDDRPCKYSSGSTSVTLGVLRAQAGRIAELNRFRSPVTASVCLSLSRGRSPEPRRRWSAPPGSGGSRCGPPAAGRRSSASHCLRPLRLDHREGTPLSLALPGRSTGLKHCSAQLGRKHPTGRFSTSSIGPTTLTSTTACHDHRPAPVGTDHALHGTILHGCDFRSVRPVR